MNQSSASKRPTDSRPLHPVRQVFVNEHSRVLKYVRTRQIRHGAVVQKCDQSMFTRLLVAHCVLLCFSLSLSHHGPFIVRSARLFHSSNGFIQLLHPSQCSQPVMTIVFCTSDVGSFQQLCDPWHIVWWCVGSMISRIPILQTCNVVVAQQQRLASFQHLHNFPLWGPS